MATRYGPTGPICARTRGFTLIEMLVALGVASVAATIAVSFFLASLSYAETARDNRVAAGLAEGQLHRLVHSPAAFVWPDMTKLEPGKPVKVQMRGEDGKIVEPPFTIDPQEARASNPRVGHRELNFQSNFGWTPYVTLPSADATLLDVSVVVRWEQSGKAQTLTLTSAMPRTQAEGRS